MPAGERDAEGQFPEGTFNYGVERTLKTMAEQRQTWQAREGEEKA
jgi:hypothetical protein